MCLLIAGLGRAGRDKEHDAMPFGHLFSATAGRWPNGVTAITSPSHTYVHAVSTKDPGQMTLNVGG